MKSGAVGPVYPTDQAAANEIENNADVNETRTNNLLNLSGINSGKTKNNNKNLNLKNNQFVDDDIFSTQNQLLSIALKKVNNIEEENKATQRAIASLKQRFNEIIAYKKDELTRNRERRF